ncbi:MAG: hypothetical protein KDD82_18760 [Planctomycetes bacterium]|nr:hypothetical protein [Planctomycetota bacterium]
MSRWAIFACAALLGACLAWADDESLDYAASGSLRVRGFSLRSRTLDRDLDPTTRLSLRLSGDDELDATQHFLDTRLRLQLRVTAYDQVSAHLAIEVGDITFGVAKQGGALGTDGVVFENKNLYLEWHPTRYSFTLRAGLYPRESDPYGLVLSDDVAGLHGEVELLGTGTELYADFIKAVENSRVDLDSDGIPDNDYNDRTVFLAGVRSRALGLLDLEGFGIADIDNTQDSPVAANVERDVYWGGLSASVRVGPARLSSTGIYAGGKRSQPGSPGVRIRGFAVDNRLTLSLPFFTLEAIFAWASGRDPSRTSTNTAFPTIAPFYGASGIVYSNFGGLNATGSNLSGTAHTTLKLRSSPTDGLDIEAVFLWAWYTSDRDVSQNVNRFNADARDLGFEADLNVTYEIAPGFKTFARGSLFFPGHGYVVQRDTRRRGALSMVILGAQFSF